MRRRWKQSRLSTWMIGVAVIAVGLAGWHRYQVAREAERAATAALIRRLEAQLTRRMTTTGRSPTVVWITPADITQAAGQSGSVPLPPGGR